RKDMRDLPWPVIEKYMRLEARITVRIAEALRDQFVKAGLTAMPYEGPGQVAGRVLSTQVLTKPVKQAIQREIPREVHNLYPHLVTGARIEAMALGPIEVPVYHYDMRSAYPTAMLSVPCLLHTKWAYATRADFARGRVQSPLWIGRVRWSMPGRQ